MSQQTPETAKRGRIELSLRENYDLCDFLKKRQPIAGETYPEIAAEANRALDSNRINATHIMSRFEALELKLKPANGSDADRIAMLEVKIARLSDLLYRFLTDTTRVPSITAALVDEFGAGQ